MPSSSARCIAAADALSSCSPQPNSQPEPPMAQAPKPIGVINKSELPSCFVFISIFLSSLSCSRSTHARNTVLSTEQNGLVRELQNCSQRAQNDQPVNDRLEERALLVFRAHEQGVGRFFYVVVWLACFHRYFFFRLHLISLLSF